MYYNGQIVFDLVKKKCVKVGKPSDGMWAWNNFPEHSVPLRHIDGRIAFPASIKIAEAYLKKGLLTIKPKAHV